MKVVFLNALDAQVAGPLRAFLLMHGKDTDVFCFQESFQRMRQLIAETLPEFTEHRASKPVLPGSVFTNVTMVRNTISVEAPKANTDTRNTGLCLFTTIIYEGAPVHIANVHGLPNPGKSDNPDRLAQSEELISAFASYRGVKIIGGDLNVLPETQSVVQFERAGYQNLIREYEIKTTRNEITWSKYPGNELYYSDYVFTKDVEVLNFEVPEDVVSDHQPMILTVNI